MPQTQATKPQGSLEVYRQKHQHPINKTLHNIGIPMIVVSLGIVFWDWRIGVGLFTLGWVLQFIGHAFEGNQPAFFKNPIYLLIGPLWWVKKLTKNLQNRTRKGA